MKRSWRRTVVRSSTLVATLAGLAGLFTARHASADEANGFGEKTQLIVSADRLMPAFSYTSQTLTATQGGATLKTTDSGTSAALLFGREPNLGVVHTIPRVAFDFTIIRHLTLGGSVAVAFGLGGTHEEDFGNNNTRRGDAAKTSSFWVFKNYPKADLELRGDRFGLAFEGLEPLYVTGLQVGHDPGVFWVYLGCVLMCLT